jgi:outer membrane protein TolC
MVIWSAARAAAGALAGVGLVGCAAPLDELEAAVLSERWSPAMVNAASSAKAADAMAMPAVVADDPELDERSSLDDCLRYAARRSPELKSAFYRWQAALERAPQVSALPDPRLTYGVFLNEVETRVGPQEQRIAVAQTLPWFGKLELREAMADEAAAAEWHRLQATMLELFWRVRRSYYRLYDLRGAIELTAENVQLLRQLEEIALARYRVGSASYADVIRIQVEHGKLEDRLLELEDRRRPLGARLNAELNRAPEAPTPWPETVPQAQMEISEGGLRAALLSANPRLGALARQIERERTAAALAHKDAWPDVTVSLDYIVTGEAANSSISESGDDAVIAGVSVNLPIWREKYEAGVREALKRRLSTASLRQQTESRLLAELEEAIFEYRDARRKAELYGGELVPRARESLESSLRAYETTAATFLDLLDAERVLLELQLARRRAKADAAIALARIGMLTAADLSGGENGHLMEIQP